MDAMIDRCAGDGFAYSPRNHTQGRAGESSPALCLALPLKAFDLRDGEAHAAPEEGGFQFSRLAPAAQGDGGDFPLGCQLGGSEKDGGWGVDWFHNRPRKKHYDPCCHEQQILTSGCDEFIMATSEVGLAPAFLGNAVDGE